MARLRLKTQLPVPGYDDETLFVVDFYVTDLQGGDTRVALDGNPDTCWLSGDELLSGVTAAGNPVVPILVTQADVIKRDRS